NAKVYESASFVLTGKQDYLAIKRFIGNIFDVTSSDRTVYGELIRSVQSALGVDADVEIVTKELVGSGNADLDRFVLFTHDANGRLKILIHENTLRAYQRKG